MPIFFDKFLHNDEAWNIETIKNKDFFYMWFILNQLDKKYWI